MRSRALHASGAMGIALAIAIAVKPANGEAVPAEQIEACIATLAGVEAEELRTAGHACPELVEALDGDPFARSAGAVPIDAMGAAHLADVVDFSKRYAGPPAGVVLEASVLDAFLRELPELERQKPRSLWRHFIDWLDSLFAEVDDIEAPSWLQRWRDRLRLPTELVSLLMQVTIGLLLVGAVAVVWNEMRHAGLIGRRRRRSAPSPTPEPSRVFTRSTADLDRAALRDRPAILLAILIELLRDRGLRIRSSSTHREVPVGATSLADAQRADLASVCMAAERVAYSAWQPGRDEIEPVVERGVALVAALSRDLPR